MLLSEKSRLLWHRNFDKFKFVGVNTTDLNYWIKHPFEFSDPILKPEYL